MGKTNQSSRRQPKSQNTKSRSQRPQTERRKWCKEEDEALTQSIMKYGTKNWCVIAANIPDRHPKQCRERWINHLDPQITKGKISEAEWKLVLKTHVKQGNRWSEIAKLLPGRTPNQIKNYWHTMSRRAIKRKNEEVSDSLSESVDSDIVEDSVVDTPMKLELPPSINTSSFTPLAPADQYSPMVAPPLINPLMSQSMAVPPSYGTQSYNELDFVPWLDRSEIIPDLENCPLPMDSLFCDLDFPVY